MTIGETPVAERVLLRMAGDLNFQRAGELKAALITAFEGGVVVDIDLSAVGEVDSVGVQLLIAAHKHAEKASKGLRFVEPSPSLRATIELLGLEGRLQAESCDVRGLA